MRYNKARFELSSWIAGCQLQSCYQCLFLVVGGFRLAISCDILSGTTLSLGSPSYHYDYPLVKSILRCTTAYPESKNEIHEFQSSSKAQFRLKQRTERCGMVYQAARIMPDQKGSCERIAVRKVSFDVSEVVQSSASPNNKISHRC